jgi:putative ABC transport system permease protein
MHIGPIVRAMKHNRTRVVLIVLEIAITLAIVTNCINVILAERQKMTQKSGFDDDNIVHLQVMPFSPEWREDGFVDPMIDRDVRTIAAVPGVKAVANTNFRMWEGGGSSTGVIVVGDTKNEPTGTQIYYSTADLVDALGVKLAEGRAFVENDHGIGSQPDPLDKVIITKSLADLLFPGTSAVGKQIVQASERNAPLEDPVTVVGVLGDFYNPYGSPNDIDVISDRAMFLPARAGGWQRGYSFQIRTEPGAANSVIAEVEKRLITTNAGRIFEWTPTSVKKARWFSYSNIVVTVMTCIIITLVVVTTLGLVGLTSLSVAERTKQIGTRRALGATRADILRHFLIENWLMTTAGLVLGIAGAYGLDFLLVSQVSDVKMRFPLVLSGMIVLWISGLLSTVPAAVKATLVPPSIATRSV